MNAGISAIAGASQNSSVSTPRGTMSSLSGSLSPSIGVEQAERPGPVRARPLLHPADDPALGPDRQQGQHHQEGEEDHDLEHDHPPRLAVEAGQRGVGRGRGARQFHGWLLRLTRVPCPARSWRRTSQPCAWVGSHARRVRHVRDPHVGGDRPGGGGRDDLTPVARASPAVAADIRATTGRAVPARNGSPSLIRPVSSNWCQVASTALGRARRTGPPQLREAGSGSPAPHASGRGRPARGGRRRRPAGPGARPSRRRSGPAPAGRTPPRAPRTRRRTFPGGPPSSRTCRPFSTPPPPAAPRRRGR